MNHILTNKNYIQTESTALPLFYNRNRMCPGDLIEGFETNNKLIKGLMECSTVVADMFWKPVGDSLLFLSVLQAAEDYLNLTRHSSKPKWVLGKKFSELLVHIPFLKDARIVGSGTQWFKDSYQRGDKVVFITDEDPFVLDGAPIFNSECYKYPKFVEVDTTGNLIAEYPSRPARYYLTFEREVGCVLRDPNESLPEFVMSYDLKISQSIKDKYSIDIDDKRSKYVAIISQTSKVEKKFGTLRFLKMIENLLGDKSLHVLFLANRHEESPQEWLKFSNEISRIAGSATVLDSEDFEELAYIFARCRVIVGNDTGFSHLASMSKVNQNSVLNPTFIVYSEHDFSKWGSGKSNVKPITTKLSRYLATHSYSVRRDKIILAEWGKEAWAYYISINKVLKNIRGYLT